MPQIDLVDDTWIRASPRTVAVAVGDPANWRRWWPELVLTVDQLRGPLGVRWWVRPGGPDRLAGSMEIWLEPSRDGTILHYFLRLDPVGAPLGRAARMRALRRHSVRSKRNFFALKDDLEHAGGATVTSSHA